MSSEVRLIENWREKWEERTKDGSRILCVAEMPNGSVQAWALRQGDMCTYFDAPMGYLIPKPQPKKLRPWRRQEVPVDAWLRCISNNRAYRIDGISECGDVRVLGGWCKLEAIFNDFVLHELNPDGTWKPTEQCRPCGVEESPHA